MDVSAPLELEREGPTPLRHQIADAIRERVHTGQWPPHYKLKAEAELAAELSVSRGTLRKALQTLVREGLLAQVQGRGTFVTNRGVDLPLAQRLVTMSEVLAEAGQRFTTEVLVQKQVPGPARIRSLLDLGPGGELLQLRRRLLVGDEPFVLLDNFVRLDLCPDVAELDFTEHSLFGALERECGLEIDWGQRSFGAIVDAEAAAWLGVGPEEPILYIEQLTYLPGSVPLEYSDVWVRGEKLRVTTILHRR